MTIEAARERLRTANSYTRIPILIDLWHDAEVTDPEWLILLGEEWSVCDNITEHLDDLLDTPLGEALSNPGPVRHLMMTDEERAAYDALPDEVTMWRGCYRINRGGLSWTTDKARAMRFPGLHRYRGEGHPLLIKATIAKADVLAVKLDRQEAEVIAPRPKHVATTVIRVPPPF